MSDRTYGYNHSGSEIGEGLKPFIMWLRTTDELPMLYVNCAGESYQDKSATSTRRVNRETAMFDVMGRGSDAKPKRIVQPANSKKSHNATAEPTTEEFLASASTRAGANSFKSMTPYWPGRSHCRILPGARDPLSSSPIGPHSRVWAAREVYGLVLEPLRLSFGPEKATACLSCTLTARKSREGEPSTN